LSRAESLEQLTWIEHGLRIAAVEAAEFPLSVNTPEDWERFKGIVEARN
jgi:CMP-2-keto-3-deoxyoctulosonic acid synthetase